MGIEALRATPHRDLDEATVVSALFAHYNDPVPVPPHPKTYPIQRSPAAEQPLRPIQSLDIRQPPPFLLLAVGPIFLLLSDGLPETKPPSQTVITRPEADTEHAEILHPDQGGDIAGLDAETPQLSVYAATQETVFTERLARLRHRIEQLIRNTWFGEYDAYELDNLIQAGIVHLWRAHRCNPAKLDAKGDAYWYAIAKRGAKYEVVRESRQRYRQVGTGSQAQRIKIETVFSAGDILAAKALHMVDEGDLDETALSCDTQYTHDIEAIRDCDRRIDIPRLERQIFTGTDPSDHPLIRHILGFMRDGLSQNQMADHLGVKSATIRCAVRRMRQACGALQESKDNRKRPGESLDEKIRALRTQGWSGPKIGRQIDMPASFVYRRLRALQLA